MWFHGSQVTMGFTGTRANIPKTQDSQDLRHPKTIYLTHYLVSLLQKNSIAICVYRYITTIVIKTYYYCYMIQS